MNKKILPVILGLDFGTNKESRFRALAYAFVRIMVAGSICMAHGLGKFKGFSQIAPHFPDPLGVGPTFSLALATGAEFFGAILLAFGLFTRWASLSLLTTMMVAFWIIHAADPFVKKELAFLYGLFFLLFLVAGGGRYSLDTWLKKKLR